jgi:regulator of RNase E activity RraA
MADLSSTVLADVRDRRQVLSAGTSARWTPAPRIACTVRCPAGDNLMLPAAVRRAEPGSIIVVDDALPGEQGVWQGDRS